MEKNTRVYLSLFITEEGVETKISPERGQTVKEAIAFLQKYDEESTKRNS